MLVRMLIEHLLGMEINLSFLKSELSASRSYEIKIVWCSFIPVSEDSQGPVKRFGLGKGPQICHQAPALTWGRTAAVADSAQKPP